MTGKIFNLESKLNHLSEDFSILKKENENFHEILKEKDKNMEILVKSLTDSFLTTLKKEEEIQNKILFEYVILNNIKQEIDNLLNDNQNFQSFCNISLINSINKMSNLLKFNNRFNEEIPNLKNIINNVNNIQDPMFSVLDFVKRQDY